MAVLSGIWPIIGQFQHRFQFYTWIFYRIGSNPNYSWVRSQNYFCFQKQSSKAFSVNVYHDFYGFSGLEIFRNASHDCLEDQSKYIPKMRFKVSWLRITFLVVNAINIFYQNSDSPKFWQKFWRLQKLHSYFSKSF